MTKMDPDRVTALEDQQVLAELERRERRPGDPGFAWKIVYHQGTLAEQA